MKKILMVLILFFSVLGVSNASLVGDTVYSEHRNGSISAPPSYGVTETAVVTEDSSDLMGPFHPPSSDPYYLVDVNASEIIVTFSRRVIWAWDDEFNGLVVFDLDDSSGNPLQDITASSSMTTYELDWITFSNSQINFNWSNLDIASGTTFSADLSFTASPVPIPSTIMLLGVGLLGITGVSRKKNNTV